MNIDLTKTKNFVVDLEDFYSDILGTMCHAKIVNNNLELTLDYDGMQFALWKYYELRGFDNALEKSKEKLEEIYKKETQEN